MQGERKSTETLLSVDDGALRQQSESERIGSHLSFPVTLESLAEMERQRTLDVPRRFSSTILALQEERDKVVQQFQDEAQRRAKQNKFSNTLLRDLDEMGKALAQSRQAAKQAKRQLAQKEAELEDLLSEKRAVLKSIIEVGPWALWDWIKREIVEQGLEPGEDFERRWLVWLAATEDVKINSSVPSMPDNGLGSGRFNKDNAEAQTIFEDKHQCAKSNNRKDGSTGVDALGKPSILRILFSIVLQEGTENVQYVLQKGLVFLPMAWFRFWMRMYGRITWHLLGVMSASLTVSLSI